MFVGAAAGACLASEHLVLEAIAAERMPHRLVVRGVKKSAFFELRDYGEGTRKIAGVLKRSGVRPVAEDRGKLLFAFDSLEARERAWRQMGADSEWVGLRDRVVLRELAVYRTLAV
jgi:hypothetical protein